MPELVPIEYDPFKGTSTPQDFAKRYGGAADKAAKELGVDSSVILGQWGLETGWGKSIVPGTNNLGNIKDFAGTGVEATDNMTGSKDKYRAYESPDAFATDYVSLVQRKYPDAVGAKTPDDFAKALKAGGYAEDPRYVDKVVQASRMAGTKPSVLATAGKAVTDAIVPSAQAAEPTLVPVDFDPFAKQAKKQSPNMITSVGAGLGKGVGTVALGAQRYLGKGLSALGADEAGGWLQRDAEQGQAKLEAENLPFKQANPTSNALGELGGNIAATLPVGGALGGVAKAAGATTFGNALASGGMTLGKTGGNAVGNMLTRMAGGAVTGGASAALVDPESTTTGAVIGGLLPPAVGLAGAAGNALARTIRGPGAAPGVAEAAQAARAAGYVLPPSQVDPSLTNRLLEGFSGKLTTAQNASAKNAEVTNSLAAKALGLSDDTRLSPEVLNDIRETAGLSYRDVASLPVRAPYSETKQNLLSAIEKAKSEKETALQAAGKLKTFSAQQNSLANGRDIALARNQLENQLYYNTGSMGRTAQSPSSLPVPGYPRFPARYTNNIDRVAEGNAGVDDAMKIFNTKRVEEEAATKALKEFESKAKALPTKEGIDPQKLVFDLRKARNDTSAWYTAYGRSADPDALAKAQAAEDLAKNLEGTLEGYAKSLGREDLYTDMVKARQLIAKTYSVEKALNGTTGTVDAKKLAQQLAKGKPLTGELKQAAEFAARFPKAAQTVEGMGSLPQTSPLDWAASGIAAATSGNPLMMAGVLARPAARQLSLSNAFQNRLVQSRTAAPQLQLTPEIRNALLQGVYRGAPVAGAER
jgi:hypothetical protein